MVAQVQDVRAGLSPRVRGNREPNRRTLDAIGSIPACAGEPAPAPYRCRPYRVYPRVCGGTRTSCPAPMPARGLSPRVRGNPARCGRDSVAGGSIPACAGEPRQAAGNRADAGVYPRVCGGTRTYGGYADAFQGLSPRVRGNLSDRPAQAPGSRSIPACAGEPGGMWQAHIHGGVYPRVCGGTPADMPLHGRVYGLSPRVRGNRRPACHLPGRAGSIPACAGEPPITTVTRWRIKVYPRVCGGTQGIPLHLNAVEGLSPRVRGNLCDRVDALREYRSIPACAGEPGAPSSQ